jgi:hypothetical protein
MLSVQSIMCCVQMPVMIMPPYAMQCYASCLPELSDALYIPPIRELCENQAVQQCKDLKICICLNHRLDRQYHFQQHQPPPLSSFSPRPFP